jgi:isoleucyl-tRNA synthetase
LADDAGAGRLRQQIALLEREIRDLRKEIERAEKRIGSSLQAAPRVHATPEYLEAFKGLDLCEIFITSDAELVEGQAPPQGAFSLPDVAGVAVRRYRNDTLATVRTS